jgi:hypothetical protein
MVVRVKPLPSAPLTIEDLEIRAVKLCGPNLFRKGERCPCVDYAAADRRDADLMFAARNWRDGSGPVPGVAVAWTDPPWSGPFRIGGTGPWGGKLPAAGNITNCV